MGTHLVEVRLELGDHRQRVERELLDRVLRVVGATAQTKRHFPVRQLVGDIGSIPAEAGQPIQFVDARRIPSPDGDHGHAQPGTFTVRSRKALVAVNVLPGLAEGLERIKLSSQVLGFGGNPHTPGFLSGGACATLPSADLRRIKPAGHVFGRPIGLRIISRTTLGQMIIRIATVRNDPIFDSPLGSLRISAHILWQ